MHKFIAFLLCTNLFLISCQSTSLSSSRTVSVSGHATMQTPPNVASFVITAENVAQTSEEARVASSKTINEGIDVLMQEFQLPSSAFTTELMNITPYYEWVDGKRVLQGQMATQRVQVSLSNLEALGRIYDRLSSIDSLAISSVSLQSTDVKEASAKVRILAVMDAKEKAMTYAKGLGLTLGDVVSISDSLAGENAPAVFRKNSLEATMVSGDTLYHVGNLTIEDTVYVTFELLR